MISASRPIDILLIEDNEGDILLTREAFDESAVPNNLHVVKNGEEGLKFLYKKENFDKVPTPDLVLLDWNMPKLGGKEVLADMKKDHDLQTIPVIVLTTSHSEQDIAEAYRLNANCYIKKPVDFDRFTDVIKSIQNFWFTVVQLPSQEY